MRELTAKRKAACENYVNDPDCMNNATKSCIKAGFSKPTAKLSGHRLITNDSCKQYIGQLRDKKLENNTERVKAWHERVLLLAKDGIQATKVRAEDMLAKHYGCYQADNQQQDAVSHVWTPEELAELKAIARRMTQIKVHKPSPPERLDKPAQEA